MIKVIGVYKISCSANRKFYIGGSSSIYRRWWEHKSKLRLNSHPNPYLQNSWNKYGENLFEFSIVETLNSLINLDTKEQFWIDKTNCLDRKIGFNISDQVEGTLYMAKQNEKSYIITFPDNTSKRITNLSKFCRLHNLHPAAMSQVAIGKSNQHKGFKCRHANTTQKQWKNSLKRSHKSGWGYKGLWAITFPDGNTETIKSLTQFCKEHKLSQGNMTEVANGKRKQHKGFKCKHI